MIRKSNCKAAKSVIFDIIYNLATYYVKTENNRQSKISIAYNNYRFDRKTGDRKRQINRKKEREIIKMIIERTEFKDLFPAEIYEIIKHNRYIRDKDGNIHKVWYGTDFQSYNYKRLSVMNVFNETPEECYKYSNKQVDEMYNYLIAREIISCMH